MDEIEKLLRKMRKIDRERLLAILNALLLGEIESLKVKKLTNSNLYRVRVGDFRIIFSVDKKKNAISVESIRRRNEKTYK